MGIFSKQWVDKTVRTLDKMLCSICSSFLQCLFKYCIQLALPFIIFTSIDQVTVQYWDWLFSLFSLCLPACLPVFISVPLSACFSLSSSPHPLYLSHSLTHSPSPPLSLFVSYFLPLFLLFSVQILNQHSYGSMRSKGSQFKPREKNKCFAEIIILFFTSFLLRIHQNTLLKHSHTFFLL